MREKNVINRIPVDWRSIIYREIESEELDYKAAQNWGRLKRAEKAKFARHCMAMANTKGGYLVVGVGEDKAGRPRLYTGLTEKEAKSFDPTDVGNFINRYSDPEVDFDIEKPVVDRKRYVVFVIRRFSSLPHVCGYSCENELQQGVFYIRTADASSRPAYRASEIHGIVQRALRNQREFLGRMLRGVLYEGKQSPEPGAENYFIEQINHSKQLYVKKTKKSVLAKGVLWEIAVFPSEFEQEKFSLSEIKRAVENSIYTFDDSYFLNHADITDSFFTNVALRSYTEEEEKFWQAFQSGLFYFLRLMKKKGDAIDYEDIIKFISEAVYFLGQFYSELGYYDELFTIKFMLTGVENVSLDGAYPEIQEKGRSGKSDYVCLIPEIKLKIQRTAADLASGATVHTVRIIREICERFNMPDGKHQDLDKVISGFIERRND